MNALAEHCGLHTHMLRPSGPMVAALTPFIVSVT
jgi:hypothetical protein